MTTTPRVSGSLVLLAVAVFLFGCGSGAGAFPPVPDAPQEAVGMRSDLEVATLGGGCFWCIEAVFQRVRGVERAVSGYAGGSIANPTYEQVCSGRTGHAEVVAVHFDPKQITYRQVLEIFFAMHDPTTLNRQGADVGTQYRSVVYTHSDEQSRTAQQLVEELTKEGAFDDPVVTEIRPAPAFYEAEEYHQDYFDKNPTQGYCRVVINPKLGKLRDTFASLLKPVR